MDLLCINIICMFAKTKLIIMAKGKSKSSVKQRIECFQAALPCFLKEQQNYLSNRKEGKRKSK